MAASAFVHFLKTLSRYLISGGLATLLHWGTMAWLISVAISANTATALGALTGALLNYLLQFHFTFRSTQAHSDAIPRYLLITSLNWCVNNALFAGLRGFTPLGVPVAQLITTLFVMVLNFIMYRRFVFNERNNIPVVPRK